MISSGVPNICGTHSPTCSEVPLALTAAAVIVGSAVILFDPIFQGLAISLMAGEVASLLLSRMTVPITYYLTHRHGDAAPAPAVSPEGVPA